MSARATSTEGTASPARSGSGLLDPAQLVRSLPQALAKLDPRTMVRSPVMFVVEVGSLLTTVLAVLEPSVFAVSIAVWLWATAVFANLAEAVAEGRGRRPVLVAASSFGGRVQLRVCDRGPGVPPQHRERMFQAFQRLGDAPAGNGVGLGLAVAKGFAEAIGARLQAEDTPGGGLTMVLDLPVATGAEVVAGSAT